MNISIDNAIYSLQANGGISRLWRALTPALHEALPEATWDGEHPDVFMSTYYQPCQNGAKSIAVVYDFLAERYPPIGAHHIDAVQKRQAIAASAACVAISESTAADCERYCGKPAVVAYPGGSDYTRASRVEVADFRQRYGLEKPYVMLAGRRGLYKNARALYQAWPLWNQHEDFCVLAVGGEAPDKDDQEFANRYDWRQVRLPDSDMPAAYTGAYALVYPSIYEGFGLPIVEAMSCGCPVICGIGGSLGEVAGEAAVLVNPLLPQHIVRGLDMLSDAGTRWGCIERGYAQAKQFSWRTMAERMADVIRRIV